MQPGLSRAIPMGILGFLVGVGIVVALRSLQSLTPALDPQIALILGTFTSAGFFIWGAGAFDPKMNQHAHEPVEGEEEHHAHHAEEDEDTPLSILSGYAWHLATLTLLIVGGLAVFAMIPGSPMLQIVGQPEASTAGIGYSQMQFGNESVEVSQLAIFAGFFIAIFVSLVVVAGGLGYIFTGLSEGVASVGAVKQTEIVKQPFESETPSLFGTLRFLVGFVVVFAIIFALFYFVLIGIIIPTDPELTILSAVNALPITILILRPKTVASLIGRGARGLARALRRLPGALQ